MIMNEGLIVPLEILRNLKGKMYKFSLISDNGFMISKSHRKDLSQDQSKIFLLTCGSCAVFSFTPIYRNATGAIFVGQWSVVLEWE